MDKEEIIAKLKEELSPETRKALSEWAKKQQEYLHTPEGQKEFVEPVVNAIIRFKMPSKQFKRDEGGSKMTHNEFIDKARQIVRDYTIENMSKGKDIPEFQVVTVWRGYILGYMKCLVTTDVKDGMYYEITYDKAANALYFDAYKRWENRKIALD